jgi:ketosteroid isomerase-like protein
MSQESVGLIQSMYQAFARGDVPAVLGAMDPAIVWNEAEGFPYADKNPYVGPGAVAAGVFGRIVADWDGFTVTPEEFRRRGRYSRRYGGTHKQTGRKIHVQFAHFWWLKGGKVVRFQQHADTLQVAKAAGA